jgi:arabinogalactan endo-1,4-beta-galactosidase
MKTNKAFIITVICAAVISVKAQNLYVCQGADVTTVSEQDAGNMSYSNKGTTVSIAGAKYDVADIDSITLTTPHPKFVGGDISLLTKYETNGAKYFDNNGNSIPDVLSFLKQQGWNALRVRLFVNPANASTTDKGQGVCQNLDYVTALGKRIKAAGFRFMLDFHYSDSWADPAKQTKPSAWSSLSLELLEDSVYQYTKKCLQTLVAAGATPDFIQTGNEISYGMLWDTGKVYPTSSNNWSTFTALIGKATTACREICPRAKIIVHIERTADTNASVSYYNYMKTYDVDYDYIGLSYYPYYHGFLAQLNNVITNLESSFPEKKIMIVETGYYHDYQSTTVDYDYSGTYPITEAGQKAFTDAMITTLNNHKNVNGLFWWFPEANEYGLDWNTKRVTDKWYDAGLFDNKTGKTESALYELQNFK